jgi:hypothetical protein
MTQLNFDDIVAGKQKGSVKTPLGQVLDFERAPDCTVWEIVEANKLPVDLIPTVCLVNGEPTLRKEWDLVLEDTDTVQFICMPRGGAFKEILMLVASLALAVFAPWAAGILGPLMGITSELGLSLLGAGIFVAGTFLLNAFFPQQKPKEPESASPTYTLTAQGNQARLGQSVPKLYGKHIMYPDMIGQPHEYFDSNQQIIVQPFGLGLGKYEVEKVRLEDTTVWTLAGGYEGNFAFLEIFFYEPGEQVTSYGPGQVVNSVEAVNLDVPHWKDSGTHKYQVSDKTIEANEGNFNLARPGEKITIDTGANAGTYTIVNIYPNADKITVAEDFADDYEAKDTIETHIDSQWVGWFTVNEANTYIDEIQVSLGFMQGLYDPNDEGEIKSNSCSVVVQAQALDSAGLTVGDPFQIGDHHYSRSSLTPQRMSERYKVPPGRYQVRLRRSTTEDPNSANDQSKLTWLNLAGFVIDDNIFPDISVMVVKMRATGQLSQQASRRWNVIETAIIPVYDPDLETWSEEPTRSIAWAAYDVLANTDYGASYPPAQIDLETLVALNTIWTSRGDYFDGIFDQKISCWEGLNNVLRVGRSHHAVVGGKIIFKRKSLQTIPRVLFTPSNIVRDSFETQHIIFTEDSPDDVIIEFMDNRTWKMNEVRCVLPDSLSEKPERVPVFGITERLQAWREGIFMAAFNARNRIVGKISTEMIGRLLVRSDLVIVAYHLYDWGQTGLIEEYDPDTFTLTVDYDTTLTGTDYIMLRKRDGQGYGPVKATQGADVRHIVLDETDLTIVEGVQGPIDDVFANDMDQQRTNYIVCETTTAFKRFTVVSGTPKNEMIDLTLIYDDPTVYTAEDDVTIPSETVPYGGYDVTTRPIISTFTVTMTGGSSSAPELTYDWSDAVPTATGGYILERSYDGYNWVQIYAGSSTIFTEVVLPGALWARVWGIANIAGIQKLFIGNFGTDPLVPEPVDDDTIEITANIVDGRLAVDWDAAVRATSYDVEVWTETTQDSLTFDIKQFDVDTAGTAYTWSSKEVLAEGGPWKNVQVKILAQNDEGPALTTAIKNYLDVQVPPVESLQLLNPPFDGGEIQIYWDKITQATKYVARIEGDGSDLTTLNLTTNSLIVTEPNWTALGGPFRDVEIGITPWVGTLPGDEVTLVIEDEAPAAPVTLTVLQTDIGQLTITWTASSDAGDPDFDGYILKRHTATFDPTVAGTIIYEGTGLSKVDTGLADSTTYYYSVGAKDTYLGADEYNWHSVVSRTVNPNLLSNGDMASDTVWTKGTGITISAGEMHAATSSAATFAQAISLTNGESYTLIYDVSDFASGSIRGRFIGGATVDFTNRTANGTYSETKTATAAHTFLSCVIAMSSTLDSDNFRLFKVS